MDARGTLELVQGWSARLGAAAAMAWRVWPDLETPAEELVRDFRDDAGHRRVVDPVFLRAVRGLPPPGEAEEGAADVRAWGAAASGGSFQGLAPGLQSLTSRRDEPIEVWTETELCVLHALWRAARLRGDGGLRARCLDAARWHLEHVQPDNATNHPWGIHVFVVLGALDGRLEAISHAEQMLHASLVRLGRPDRLSGHILEDGGAELRRVF